MRYYVVVERWKDSKARFHDSQITKCSTLAKANEKAKKNEDDAIAFGNMECFIHIKTYVARYDGYKCNINYDLSENLYSKFSCYENSTRTNRYYDSIWNPEV